MIRWFSKQELQNTITYVIRDADVVLDIGCGIRPQEFLKPVVGIYVDAHEEYLHILSQNLANTRSIIINGVAQEVLKCLPDRCVDSIFMLDFIEHVEKSTGKEIISHCERIARKQIILFTPLGFMSQEYQEDDNDGWGLSGTEWQAHKSGWDEEDFDAEWDLYACKSYHFEDSKGEPLAEPHGAFFAIKNVREFVEENPIQSRISLDAGEPYKSTTIDQSIGNLSKLLVNEVYARVGKWETRLVEKEEQLKRIELQIEHKAAQLYERESDFDKRANIFNQELIRKEADLSERSIALNNLTLERNQYFHQHEAELEERGKQLVQQEQDLQKRVDAFNEIRLRQEQDFANRVANFDQKVLHRARHVEYSNASVPTESQVQPVDSKSDARVSEGETKNTKSPLQVLINWLQSFKKNKL